jgi:hypothetical protein
MCFGRGNRGFVRRAGDLDRRLPRRDQAATGKQRALELLPDRRDGNRLAHRPRRPSRRNHLGKYRSTLCENHPVTKIEVWHVATESWVDVDRVKTISPPVGGD